MFAQTINIHKNVYVWILIFLFYFLFFFMASKRPILDKTSFSLISLNLLKTKSVEIGKILQNWLFGVT